MASSPASAVMAASFILLLQKTVSRWLRYLLFAACLLPMTFLSAQADEYFVRGTPNNWAATPMSLNASTTRWESTLHFSGANSRFKISRYNNNWNQSWPAQDYLITGGEGNYRLTFDVASQQVTATRLADAISAHSICYRNQQNFTQPRIYFWNATPTASLQTAPAWPGLAMKIRGNFACFDFTNHLAATSMPSSLQVIFNNNGASQTTDLNYTGQGCYDAGSWKSLAACGFEVSTTASSSSSTAQSSSAFSSSSSSAVVNATRIYFHNSPGYSQPRLHYFNAIPAAADSTWPGVAMTSLGENWYVYQFATAVNSAGIVFSDNGQRQTADLQFQSAANCYYQGRWQTATECGVGQGAKVEAGNDRRINAGTRVALHGSFTGNYLSAVWTSNAWQGELTGLRAVSPAVQQGEYTVTLTVTDSQNNTVTDSFNLSVVAAERGLAERPLVGNQLKFPITGNVSSGNYRFEKAWPALDNHFTSPVMVLADGINALMYVVDKTGSIFVFPDIAAAAPTDVVTLLNINNVVRNYHEQGLLSMAFDPNFAQNGFFYIYYIYGTDDNERAANGLYGDAILERWTVNNPLNPTGVIANSKIELLRIPQPGPDHKGGMMQFHPEDGYLYLSVGDGAYGHSAITSFPQDPRTNNNAQITSNLLGTTIRIQPLAEPVNGAFYAVPSDNPFVNTDGFRPEIWSYGHRNPWRWAFDSEAPYTLWQTEVGQSGFEEVNLIEKGKNYGWPVCEGLVNRGALGGAPDKNCSTDFEPPREGYNHPAGFSIIGGVVYRGNRLPELNGHFIFGDYVTKRIWSIVDGEAKQLVSDAFPENIASFGLSSSGNDLLVSTYGAEYGGSSSIYRVVDDAVEAAIIPQWLSQTGLFASTAELIPSHGVIEYSVNSDGWFDGAAVRHFMAVPDNTYIGFDPNELWSLPVGSVLVKHFLIATADNSEKPFTTSVLFRQESGWQSVNYVWNAAGTDAERVTETYDVNDGGLEPRTRTVQSAADCGSCHIGSGSREPLAMHTRQLNRLFDYNGVSDNQLALFDHIGLFDVTTGAADDYDSFAALDDPAASLQQKAKAYLQTNCAHCHASSFMDLRYDTPLEQMRLVNIETTGGQARLRPFEHSESLIYIYQTVDGNRMPKGTRYTNPLAASVFQQWIDAVDAIQTSITIQASRQTLTTGSQVKLSVAALFDNGFSQPYVGDVIWQSSDNDILDLSQQSSTTIHVAPQNSGSVTVSVIAGNFSAEIVLNVTGSSSSSSSSSSQAAITELVIAPGDIAVGQQQQLVAYGLTASRDAVNLYGQIEWRVVNTQGTPANATITTTGLLQRLAAGDIAVEARYQSLQATRTFSSQSNNLAVRYDNPNQWNQVYIYLWTVNNGVNQVAVPWPGVPVTVDSSGWWSYHIPVDRLLNGAVNIIFNNGAGAQTPDLLNVSQPSSYQNGQWTPWNPTGTGNISRLSVIGGSTANNLRDFPEGAVVTITANEAPYGTRFTGWTGDGVPWIFTDLTQTVIQLVVPDHGVAFQAVFVENEHAAAHNWYAAQCASCHGAGGEGGTGPVLNALHNSSTWSVSILADYINDFMPVGDTGQCIGTQPGECAHDVASMILANAWEQPCNGQASCSDGTLDARNLRLLTREEYFNSVSDIFAMVFPADLMASVPVDGRLRNFDTASFLVADYERTLGYEMVAARVASLVVAETGFNNLAVNCSQARCVVETLGRKIFRRPLTTTEANRYTQLYDAADAGKAVLQALLMSPHFMYRSEMGVADATTNNYRLTPHEIATLLSYTFHATTPDEILLAAADSGQLNIAQQVERLLADPRAERGLRRFIAGWLINNQYGFAAISDVALVEAFKEETIRFVLESIRENKPFNSLLTANYTYANNLTAAHYGIPSVSGQQWVQIPYADNDARRGAGLLGHASFLASRTSTVNPAPIKRGVFVREVLMCQEFPPPAAADFNVVFEPGDSNRDATARHTSDPACASCHQYIDGVGFGFESFGSDALFRTIEQLANGTQRPIDATGSIKSLHSAETTLDPNSESIAYTSIPQLANLIANSGQGAACYSRQFYRYSLGRNEARNDEEIIRQYSQGVRQGGGMRDMLVDFATSDSFVLRR
jgi:glucose/arabinose dehydrogenase